MTTATRRGDPYAVDRIREAAALLRHRASRSTPGPWRLGNSPYAALVADQPHPSRGNAENGGWAWDDGYGGCLVAESMMTADRLYMASMNPVVGLALADLMDTVAYYGQRAQMSETGFESFDTIASAILGVIPDKRDTGGAS